MDDSIIIPDDPIPGDFISSEDGIPVGVVRRRIEDGKVEVFMDNGHLVNISYKPSGPAKCECGSEKVYYDLDEEWVCPFCDL